MPRVLIVDDNAELASLLAAVADAHGLSAIVAHSGHEALSWLEGAPPDAGLVDLLLPDMRGHDLIRELATRGVPCFAMSGVFRGEALAKEAVEAYGAKGFFEKPFTAHEPMARIAELLTGRQAVESPAPAEPLEELRLDDDDSEEAPEQVPPLEAMEATTQTTGIFAKPDPCESGAAPHLSAALPAAEEPSVPPPFVASRPAIEPAGIVPPAELCVPQQPSADAPAGALEPAPVTSALPPTPATSVDPFPASEAHSSEEPVPESQPLVLPFSGREVWQPASARKTRAARAEADFKRTGSLAETSLPRLLTALHLGRQTGELRLRNKEIVKVVAVHEGRLAFAASNLGSERFARFAVRAGALPADKLAYVQSEARNAGMRTGEAMVALGLVDESGRKRLLERQIKEIVWSAFSWAEGDYQLALRANPRADLVEISLAPGPLVLEGYREAFSLVDLRQRVDPSTRYCPTADPPFELHELGLGDQEALLLAYADGTKTVEDLLLLVDLPERDSLAVLHGLVQLGILEARASLSHRSRVFLA